MDAPEAVGAPETVDVPSARGHPCGHWQPSRGGRTLNPAGGGLSPRRWGLAPRRRPAQRERERERRVSDADASYYRPISDTRTLKHVHSQRNHANDNSLSNCDPVPLPRAPSKQVGVDHRANPNPTLCLSCTHMGTWNASKHTSPLAACQPHVHKGRTTAHHSRNRSKSIDPHRQTQHWYYRSSPSPTACRMPCPRGVSCQALGSPLRWPWLWFSIRSWCSRRLSSLDICPWSVTPASSPI
jgi:hypothetical protein